MANNFYFSDLYDMIHPKRNMAEQNQTEKQSWLRRSLDAAKTFSSNHTPDRADSIAFIGAGLIVRGIAMWSLPAAFIFAGLALLFVAFHALQPSTSESK